MSAITETAGCARCDAGAEMIDDVHHADGSVCPVMARNLIIAGRAAPEPLGRYDPRMDVKL